MPPKTPRKPERPVLWIVAGPNGSGKSSLYNLTDIEGWGGSVWIVNPDLLTQAIVDQEQQSLEAANLEAVQRIERWLYASIAVHQTIGVETVMSSDKYRTLVTEARVAGFRINMIYVVLASAELQAERIGVRVKEGGHDVPAAKILSRRLRSFEQLGWFISQVDECFVFDNSTGEPALIAEKTGRGLLSLEKLPDDMRRVLDHAGVFVYSPKRQ